MASLGDHHAVVELPGRHDDHRLCGVAALAHVLSRARAESRPPHARRTRLGARCRVVVRARSSTAAGEELTVKLQEKTVIVTGGDSGIGRAISLRFAREGARVVIDYLGNAEPRKALVDEIENFGGRAYAVEANIARARRRRAAALKSRQTLRSAGHHRQQRRNRGKASLSRDAARDVEESDRRRSHRAVALLAHGAQNRWSRRSAAGGSSTSAPSTKSSRCRQRAVLRGQGRVCA